MQLSWQAEQTSPEPPECHILSFPPIDLCLQRCHRRHRRSIPAKFPKLMLQMLFALIGDITDPPFGLEVGDELSRDGSGLTMGIRSPDLNGLLQFFSRPEGDLLAGLNLDGFACRRVPAHPGG